MFLEQTLSPVNTIVASGLLLGKLRIRTECVIDTVQAAAYLGQAVVFLYKAIDSTASGWGLSGCMLAYVFLRFRGLEFRRAYRVHGFYRFRV